VMILENALDTHSEGPGQPKGQKQRRDILSRLQRDDRLPRDPNPNGQLLLGHLTMVEPQAADQVADRPLDIGIRRHRGLPDHTGSRWLATSPQRVRPTRTRHSPSPGQREPSHSSRTRPGLSWRRAETATRKRDGRKTANAGESEYLARRPPQRRVACGRTQG